MTAKLWAMVSDWHGFLAGVVMIVLSLVIAGIAGRLAKGR